MNPLLTQFLRSIGITLGVSILLGVVFVLLQGTIGSFFAGTLLGVIIQVIGSFLWKTFLIHRANIQIAQIDGDITKEEIDRLSRQDLNVTCSYCRAANKTTIQMNRENTFRCVACNQLNAVMITVSTARVTVPLDLNSDKLLEKAVAVAEGDQPVTIESKDLSKPLTEVSGA